MQTALPAFFLVLFIGLFSSTLLKKLHLPWVAALILGGIAIGPHGLGFFESDSTIEFISDLGLIFLMFMAGLEVKLSSFKESAPSLFLLSLVNGLIPFVAGLAIAYYYGYSFTTLLLLGTVFISSSVAVVIPTLEANDLFDLKIGRAVTTTSIIQDVLSLILLSVLLQDIKPVSNLPPYFFYPLLLAIVVGLRLLLPKLQAFVADLTAGDDPFQDQLRSVFLVLLGTVILFEVLGLHPIVGGFFAGVVLSETIDDEVLKAKIRALSYGFFIPTFFVYVGTQTDVSLLFEVNSSLPLILLIVFGSILSKFLSGWLGAWLVGFNPSEGAFFGASSIPQLSTTLAVAHTARSVGLMDDKLITALVVLSMVSTLVGPALMVYFRDAEFLSLRREDSGRFVKGLRSLLRRDA
ncbi:hypothetical protein GF360_00380 [candidate division WWE3 bacterium]|nr:hypothetical protein [candidate division WWE3 bacterium]